MAARNDTWQGMNWCRPSTRLAVYLRDGLACVYCGDTIEEGTKFTLDHITPVSKGGTNKPKNLVTCCHRCNSSRGNRSVVKFADAVASYLNHGIKGNDIIAHINRCRKKVLPRAQARNMLKLRGTVKAALEERSNAD